VLEIQFWRLLLFGLLIGVAMNSVGFAFQLHDRRAVHDAIQEGHRQWRIAEVFGPRLEVDVGHQGRADPLTACVDDLVPQAGGLRTEAAFDAASDYGNFEGRDRAIAEIRPVLQRIRVWIDNLSQDPNPKPQLRCWS